MGKVNKPTDSELEILSILWDKGNATVKDVHEVIQQTKKVGYTTTLKLLQIMNNKGLVTRNISAKKHVYAPCLVKASIQEQLVGKLIQTLFNGSATQLMLELLGNYTPTKNELSQIKLLIEKMQANN